MHLAISSNSIDKMVNFGALENLEILSLGRNQIKKIAGLEEVGAVVRNMPTPRSHAGPLSVYIVTRFFRILCLQRLVGSNASTAPS